MEVVSQRAWIFFQCALRTNNDCNLCTVCFRHWKGARFSLKGTQARLRRLGYNYFRAAVVTTWVPMHRGKFFWMVVLLGASQPHLFAVSS